MARRRGGRVARRAAAGGKPRPTGPSPSQAVEFEALSPSLELVHLTSPHNLRWKGAEQGRAVLGAELESACEGAVGGKRQELAVGAEVNIEFTPPYSGEPIRVRCGVRDRNGYIYGVEFLADEYDEHDRVDQIRVALKAMGTRMS